MYFLIVLKNLLPGKSVSIAAPASYWYLKGFPIAQMSSFLDYIVFMTYDLHGQVSVDNYQQPSLQSHTNLIITHTVGRWWSMESRRMPVWQLPPESCQLDRDAQCFDHG